MINTKKPLYIGAFLVGVHKCGTTTLSDWLFQHPQIMPVKEYMADQSWSGTASRKETTAADKRNRKSSRVMLSRIEGASIDWNKNKVRVWLFRSRRWEYVNIKKQLAGLLPDRPQTRPNNCKTMAADCSCIYFDSAGVAEAIKNLYPDARILITLRHPADRIYSWYYMKVRRHEIKEPFHAAVINQLTSHGSRPAEGLVPPTSSHQALACWLDVFSRERIKILIMEEWRRRPIQTAQECYHFIGVDDAFVPRPRRLNMADGGRRRYPVSWLAIQYHHLACLYAKRYGGAQTRMVKKKWMRFAHRCHLYDRKRPPMSREVRRQLDDYFKPEVEAIESLLRRKIPAWHRDD